MARDLRDVADYFLPRGSEAEPADERASVEAPPPSYAPGLHPAALPILSVVVGERDVVRAAFAWNLVVEAARLGASATLLATRAADAAPLWPDAGPGPVGSHVALVDSDGPADLHRAALDVAVSRAADGPEAGLVVACVPPEWLQGPHPADAGPSQPQAAPRSLLRWVLLFAGTDRRDLLETYALAKRLLLSDEEARVGVAIHGARGLHDARSAFEHLAGVAQRHLGRAIESYGLLVDDLHVYRAIVSRRPIGIEHPQSRAARALRDVARMILEDARSLARA